MMRACDHRFHHIFLKSQGGAGLDTGIATCRFFSAEKRVSVSRRKRFQRPGLHSRESRPREEEKKEKSTAHSLAEQAPRRPYFT